MLGVYTMEMCFFLYIKFIAPESRLAKYCIEQLPNKIILFVQKRFGSKIADPLRKLHRRWMEKHIKEIENPTQTRTFFFIFFGGILGTWGLSFKFFFPMISSSRYLSSRHIVWGNTAYLVWMGCLIVASKVQAGTITELTMPKFDNYEYDNILFVNKICETTNIRKLPRSKFCKYTKRHVPRYDHYCVWLNQPIGEENYRYFLMCVISTTFLCWYGSYILTFLIWVQLRDEKWFEGTLNYYSSNLQRANMPWTEKLKMIETAIPDIMRISKFLAEKDPVNRLIAVILSIALLLGFILTCFTFFHLSLVYRNMTTNESIKWKEIRKAHIEAKRGYHLAMRAKKEQARNENSQGKKFNPINVANSVENIDVGCTGVVDAPSDFQKEKITNSDKLENDEIHDPGPWLKNKYDLGIMNNIHEVIFPRSERKEVMEEWIKFLFDEKKRKDSVETEKSKKKKK